MSLKSFLPFYLMHPLSHIFEGVSVCDIVHNDDTLSTQRDILEICETRSEVYDCKKKEKKLRKEFSFNFREFWSEFPENDSLDDEIGFRPLKKNKEQCSVLYENLLKEYPSETILKCLKYEVAARKDQSKIRKENLMKYFSNSFFWLKNRKFEPYLKLIEKGEYKSKEPIGIINTNEIF